MGMILKHACKKDFLKDKSLINWRNSIRSFLK